MLNIAICDADTQFINKTVSSVTEYCQFHDIAATLFPFISGANLLYEVKDGTEFDLVILDVVEPNENGLETASQIKEMLPYCLILFVTCHAEYAADAFEVSAFRYILKSEINEKLFPALDAAGALLKTEHEQSYVLSHYNHLKRIFYRDIVFISKNSKSSIFHLLSGDELRERKSLEQIYCSLESKDFFFANRSYIVNVSNVIQIDDESIFCRNGSKIPVSRKYRANSKNIIKMFWKTCQ